MIIKARRTKDRDKLKDPQVKQLDERGRKEIDEDRYRKFREYQKLRRKSPVGIGSIEGREQKTSRTGLALQRIFEDGRQEDIQVNPSANPFTDGSFTDTTKRITKPQIKLDWEDFN